MIISERDLLAILADGHFHSGQELANEIGVSRTAIWKHLLKLKEKGIVIQAVRGKGYRLFAPVELLDQAVIFNQLNPSAQKNLAAIRILYETGSTNEYLRATIADDSIHANVVLAEYQSQGKGRGNNRWLTGMASGLCLSIGWHFASAPATLSALSLATGVVLSRSLGEFGGQPVQLKWPNDLISGNAKLGGILIESRGQLAGSVDVIIGIGLNINMPTKVANMIDQDVTDMTSVLHYRPSRNQLAASIINHMFSLLSNYEVHGFDEYIDTWRKLDYGRGKQAKLHLPHQVIAGQIMDIDERGYLVMLIDGKLVKYSSGDLSLRISA